LVGLDRFGSRGFPVGGAPLDVEIRCRFLPLPPLFLDRVRRDELGQQYDGEGRQADVDECHLKFSFVVMGPPSVCAENGPIWTFGARSADPDRAGAVADRAIRVTAAVADAGHFLPPLGDGLGQHVEVLALPAWLLPPLRVWSFSAMLGTPL
jgi:hypothetical protein